MTPSKPTNEQLNDDAAEAARVAAMSDAEVLLATGHGRFGKAIVGEHLAARSLKLMTVTGDGIYGPAIVDPDYAAKQAAARAAEAQTASASTTETDGAPDDEELEDDLTGESDDNGAGDDVNLGDPMNLKDPANPWTYVMLSGAKMLAQKHGVSYKPRVTRVELIAALQAAAIVPPPVPADKDDDGPQ